MVGARRGPGAVLGAILCWGALAAAAAQGQAAEGWTPAANRESAKAVAGIVRREYMDAGVAATVSAELERRARARQYDSPSSASTLADLLTRHLFELTRDKHLAVAVVRDAAPSSNPGARPSRADEVRRSNGGVQRVEILPGNIGYLNVTHFWRLEEARPALDAALRVLRDADALIVDVRWNAGGSPDTVVHLLSHVLAGAGDELFRIIPRTGDASRYTIQDVDAAARRERRPMHVLTSKRTFSAGEGFAYVLQERTRAEVVGERTAGAANPGKPYPVNQWLEVTVPNGRVQSAVRHGNWEGTGVVPDFEVDASAALEVAHRRAVRTLMASASGERARQLGAILEGLERRN